MTGETSAVRRFLPPVAVMAAIFVLSHQPAGQLSLPSLPGIDKLAHAVIYGLLAITVIRSFSRIMQQSRPGIVVMIAGLWCLLYGLSDECHQSFVPGRFVSGLDVLADLVGALIAGAIWLFYRQPACRKKDCAASEFVHK
jgi:hypothetical protein